MMKICLRKLLEDRMLTQADVAEMSGIRPSTICDMCNGNTKSLRITSIDKLCAVLDCDVGDIIKYIPSHIPTNL